MIQELIVFTIVALAAVYAVWHWMPGAWRRALAARVASGSRRAGLVDGQGAERLAATLGKSGGCGACDSCGSCATPGRPGSDTGAR